MKSKSSIPTKKRLIRLSVKHMARGIFLIYRLYEEKTKGKKDTGSSLSLSVAMVGCTTAKQVEFKDISISRAHAVRLFETFSRGRVTPTVADEILSDLLGTEMPL